MRLGDIYNFTDNRIRIIMFDDLEVFYMLVDNDNIFNWEKIKTLSYYRVQRYFFDNNSNFIGSKNLSEQELEIHRPDLPLRLNCFKDIFWTNDIFNKLDDLESYLKLAGISIDKIIGLNNNRIIISPTSQLISSKQTVLLENNQDLIDGKDLLYKCFEIQKPYIKKDKPYFSRFRLIPDGR